MKKYGDNMISKIAWHTLKSKKCSVNVPAFKYYLKKLFMTIHNKMQHLVKFEFLILSDNASKNFLAFRCASMLSCCFLKHDIY